MTEPQVAVLIFCPRCRVQGEGNIAAAALANIVVGAWRIDCPLCGSPTRVRRAPARPS